MLTPQLDSLRMRLERQSSRTADDAALLAELTALAGPAPSRGIEPALNVCPACGRPFTQG
ncbi:MAG: hypothetical protein HY275_10160 [Gemmatimonadetes bacterium]|nr:hypothetical protein [Gemmatimonadota bacterium]